MVKIGIDVVEVERFVKVLESGGESFLEKHFWEEELKGRSGEHLAGVFAAKEAIFKTGRVKRLDFLAVKIVNSREGEPVVYKGKGKRMREIEVSVSHAGGMAVAVAVWNKDENNK